MISDFDLGRSPALDRRGFREPSAWRDHSEGPHAAQNRRDAPRCQDVLPSLAPHSLSVPGPTQPQSPALSFAPQPPLPPCVQFVLPHPARPGQCTHAPTALPALGCSVGSHSAFCSAAGRPLPSHMTTASMALELAVVTAASRASRGEAGRSGSHLYKPAKGYRRSHAALPAQLTFALMRKPEVGPGRGTG